MRSVRILVTGSREWADTERLAALFGIDMAQAAQMAVEQRDCMVETLRAAYEWAADAAQGGEIVLVHGNALGADRLAADIWRRAGQARPDAGMRLDSHPARWQRDGQSAGYQRNARMVAAGADIVLAFHVQRSKGTEHCISLAVRAHIPVGYVSWRDGEQKPLVWLNAENITRFLPPLGARHTTIYQQMSVLDPVVEEAVPELPQCPVCGGEGTHIAECVAITSSPVPYRVTHDTAIGQDRCGACGQVLADSPEQHTEELCYAHVLVEA